MTGSETVINTRTIGTDASNVESCGRENVTCDIEFLNEGGNGDGENLSDLSMASGAAVSRGPSRRSGTGSRSRTGRSSWRSRGR